MPDQYLVAALICFVMGGIFSLAEGALKGLTGKRLENLLRNNPDRMQRLTSFLYRKTEVTYTARLIALASVLGWIVLAIYAEHIRQIESGDDSFLRLVEIFAAALTIAVIIERIILVRVGARLSARFSSFLAPPLHMLWVALRPLTWLLRGRANLVDRVLGHNRDESEEERITEEVMSALAEGERREVIEEEQKEMIRSVLELGDSDVAEIMTPRVNMVAIEADTPIVEAVKFCAGHHFSRIPAFRETRDNIVGILYVKDLLGCLNGQREETDTILPILREPMLVPETKKAGDLLQEFQEKKIHLAIVLDEYGGTAGIVTLEDVLEEIVGEIRDEYDTSEEPSIVPVSDGIVEARAAAHIDEINEALNTSLPESPEYETIGGLIFEQLGRVPSQNEKITCRNAQITILRCDRRKIHRVRIALVPEETGRNSQDTA